MKSNTEFHQLTWCPFPLHKTQIYPVALSTEAVDFGMNTTKSCRLTFHAKRNSAVRGTTNALMGVTVRLYQAGYPLRETISILLN